MQWKLIMKNLEEEGVAPLPQFDRQGRPLRPVGQSAPDIAQSSAEEGQVHAPNTQHRRAIIPVCVCLVWLVYTWFFSL